MKNIILQIDKELIKVSNNDLNNKLLGEKVMWILLENTNLYELKNPIKTFRKIIAKLMQKRDVQQVLKYCRLVGLHLTLNNQFRR